MIFLIYGCLALMVALFSGMLVGGGVGLASLVANAPMGLERTVVMANINAWSMSNSFTLAAVPLFIFMGEIVARSELIMKLFRSFLLLTRGKVPGGLLQPVILTSTIFAACSGSSTASAGALGSIIFPDLMKQGYPKGLSAGTLAAGGSLAMLIPPSIILVIFGSITDASIASLYLGAFIPGAMIAVLFTLYVALRIPKPPAFAEVDIKIEDEGEVAAASGREKFVAFLHLMAFAGLMLTVMAPLYLGIATATEVGALGSGGAILLSLIYRKMSLDLLWQAARGAVQITGMVYFIVFGTLTFSMALASTGVAAKLPMMAAAFGNEYLTMLGVFILYLIMGIVFDPISILLLATPFMAPILKGMGFSMVWCGVFIALMIEMSLLTPPVGINLFVLHGSTRVPFMEIAKGCLPFVIILLLVGISIYLFPEIVEWLPNNTK